MFDIFYGPQFEERKPARIHNHVTRGTPTSKKKVHYCDICWIPHYWSQHRPSYWENYARENWQKLSAAALEFGYKHRYLDVTWHCVSGEMRIRNIEDAECYEAVAADMGVFV